jgi:hypothetical protein
MLFRTKIIAKGHYVTQWCNWWWPFWKDEGTVFSNLTHAMLYEAELRAAQGGV